MKRLNTGKWMMSPLVKGVKEATVLTDIAMFTSQPASPPPPTTSTMTTTKLWALWSALMLLLPVVSATNPRVLSKPPRVINATDTSLTLKADVQCPPNCNVSELITWEIKGNWVGESQKTRIFENQNTTICIGDLTSSRRYEVRALLQLKDENTTYEGKDVPVVSAYTCTEMVPEIVNLRVVEIGATHFVIKWTPGNESCVSVTYSIHKIVADIHHPFENPGCSPEGQPKYSCYATQYGQECTASLDDVKPAESYLILVTAAWRSHCSIPEFVIATAKRQQLLGVSVAAVATSIAVLLLAATATSCVVFTLRKRRASRDAADQRMGFSRNLPRAAYGRTPDSDGYLLTDADVQLLSYERL